MSSKKLIELQEISKSICSLLVHREKDYLSEIKALQNKAGLIDSNLNEMKIKILSEQINGISKLLVNEYSKTLRYYAVIPGKIYAGEIPSSIDENLIQKKIDLLLSLGITKVINLTEIEETNFKGIPLKEYEGILRKSSQTEMIRMSIKDLNIPTVEHMCNIISKIDSFIEKDEVIYIHCWGGIGRTGTVVGCYLIDKKIITSNLIIPYISFLKRNTEINNRNSPETDEQVEFLLDWH